MEQVSLQMMTQVDQVYWFLGIACGLIIAISVIKNITELVTNRESDGGRY
jgi:hypothetical protein